MESLARIGSLAVADDRSGLSDAALWFLTCMVNAPVLTPERVAKRMDATGFAEARLEEPIPDLAQFAVAYELA